MTIGIDASPAARKEKTGVEWYTYHLLHQFALQDTMNNYILYTSNPFPDDEKSFFPKNFTEKILHSPTKWFWPQTRLTWNLLASGHQRPDVWFSPADALPLIQSKKIITTIHDVGFIPYKDIYEWKRQQYLYWTTRNAVKRAHIIITISEFTKSEIIKYYHVDPTRIVVVPLGFDAGVYTPASDSTTIADALVLRQWDLIPKNYILTISPLEHKKNVPTLIDAFSVVKERFPDLKLVIAGKPRLATRAIEEKIINSRYKDDILSLGWVDQDQQIALLRNAAVFSFPSFYEGFGLPIIEAQSCHVPVVASYTASLPEVGGGGALYHNVHSSEDLAEKLNRLMNDSVLRQDLIIKGLENIKRFSWEKCAKKTLELLT
ncbi:MAG: glycosyltransferase family 1 protein [bacterium]|nr:glycosyltransferase family 1 protein [bacterium]